MSKKKIKTDAQSGTVNDLIQLVRRPGYFSKEAVTERKAIKQAQGYLDNMDCRFCECNNTLEAGGGDMCSMCTNIKRNITARKTYLHGGALIAPGTPYYNVTNEDVTEVDSEGKLIRYKGIDVDVLVDLIVERLGQTSDQTPAPDKTEKTKEKSAEDGDTAADEPKKAEKTPSKTLSDAPAKENAEKSPGKKTKFPPIPPVEKDPFDGIDAGSKRTADEPQQLSVDDYDELNDAPIPEFLKD